jgi:hypothetical protein
MNWRCRCRRCDGLVGRADAPWRAFRYFGHWAGELRRATARHLSRATARDLKGLKFLDPPTCGMGGTAPFVLAAWTHASRSK